MSVSAISSAQPRIPQTPPPGRAADGDSAVVEAAESAATQKTEKANGGYMPKTSSPAVSATREPANSKGGLSIMA